MASGSATVIDLTDEPDSPVLQTRAATGSEWFGQGQSGQGGPSGQSGQPGQSGQVIDLTEIDDDDGDVVISGSRAVPPRQQWGSFDPLSFGEGGGGGGSGPGHEPIPGARQMFGLSRLNAFGVGGLGGLARFTNYALDSIPSLGNSGVGGVGSVGGGSGGRNSHAGRFGRNFGAALRQRPARGGAEHDDVPLFGGSRSILNPLGSNQPDLNYQSNGSASLQEQLQHYYTEEVVRHHRAHAEAHRAHQAAHHHAVFASAHTVSTKPPYVAPPEPPLGFTRSTGEDIVAVCVGCDEELVYDSNQAGDASKEGERASKRKQSRREREEHPFWGVTGCGHVYCRRCFDNRRNVLKDSRQPLVEFKTDGKSVFCAAEGCNVDVTAKKAWVGLFV